MKRKTPLRRTEFKRGTSKLQRKTKLRAYRKKQRMKFTDINGVTHYPSGREVCDWANPRGRAEYAERKKLMWERQGHVCGLQISRRCPGRLSLEEVTFEHQDGRGAGKRDDRIEIGGQPYNLAACVFCNRAKGSRSLKSVLAGSQPLHREEAGGMVA